MCVHGVQRNVRVRLRGVVFVVLRTARLAELGVQVPLEVGVDVSLVAALSSAVVLRWDACERRRKEERENLRITREMTWLVPHSFLMCCLRLLRHL